MRRIASAVMAAVMGCAVISGCEAGTSDTAHGSTGSPGAAVTTAVGPSGGTVSFPGGSVEVPAGAVEQTHNLHTGPADATPSDVLAEVTLPMTRAVSLDLSGAQPSKPLMLTLPVDRPPPSEVTAEQVFLATAPSSGESPRLIPARYDAVGRALSAEIDHLSVFWGVWVDGASMAGLLARTMVEVLAVRAPRPSSCTSSARLHDGRTVSLSAADWAAGSDPLLWGCLSAPAPGRVAVSLSNNRPMAYSLQVPDGAELRRPPPTFSSSAMELLFLVATTGRTRGQTLFPGGSKVILELPASVVPDDGSPIVVAGVHAQMQVVAASAAQTAFLLIERLLIGGKASATLDGATHLKSNLDCLGGMITTVLGLDQVDLVPAVRAGLLCLKAAAGTAARESLTLLALASSFAVTFTSAIDLVYRQLTGTVSTSIALAGGPTTPPASRTPTPPPSTTSSSPRIPTTTTSAPSTPSTTTPAPPTTSPPAPSTPATTTSAPPTTSTPPEPVVDLTVPSMWLLQGGVCAGTSVTFRSELANEGSAPSGEFAIRWIVDDGQTFDGGHAGIPGGGRSTYDHIWNDVTEGPHTLTFVVDAYDHVAETDENNNTRTFPFTGEVCAR